MPRYHVTDTLGGVYVQFDYAAGLIDEIKELPRIARRWCPERRAWFIDRLWLPQIRQLLHEWGYTDATHRPHEPPKPPSPASPWSELHLTEDAPEPVVKAAYRALAGMHHPDVGGQSEDMKRINLAYEAITRGVGARSRH